MSRVDKRVHIPKDLVSSSPVGDDIDKWFEAYEVALEMHRIPEEDWGASLWRHMLNKGRNSLLAMGKGKRVQYPLMKEALVRVV